VLDVYVRIGRALYRVRVALFAGMLAGLGFFVAGIFGADARYAESRTLLPALAFAWCLCMTVFAYAFRSDIPAVDPAAGLWRRIVVRGKRALWHLLALLMTGLGAGALLLTLRALLIVRNEFGGL